MKKIFCCLFLISLLFSAEAQDSRDNIIGRYNVQSQQDNAGPIWWDTLIVSKHSTDLTQIFVWFTYLGGGDYYIFDSTNASFYEYSFPSLEYGDFSPNDSIFLHFHLYTSTAPFYREYWGFKDPLSVGLINTQGSLENFIIYPNPVSSELRIQGKNITQKAVIKIFDSLGREVYTLQVKDNEEIISINTSLFDKGIYFFIRESEQGIYTKKVVIQ